MPALFGLPSHLAARRIDDSAERRTPTGAPPAHRPAARPMMRATLRVHR
jgi:hypothetical protein